MGDTRLLNMTLNVHLEMKSHKIHNADFFGNSFRFYAI